MILEFFVTQIDAELPTRASSVRKQGAALGSKVRRDVRVGVRAACSKELTNFPGFSSACSTNSNPKMSRTPMNVSDLAVGGRSREENCV